MSTSGRSTPSLNRSTANSARTRAGAQLQQRLLAVVAVRIGGHRERRQAGRREPPRHELRVRDADAEAQRAHVCGVPVLVRSCCSTIRTRASLPV